MRPAIRNAFAVRLALTLCMSIGAIFDRLKDFDSNLIGLVMKVALIGVVLDVEQALAKRIGIRHGLCSFNSTSMYGCEHYIIVRISAATV